MSSTRYKNGLLTKGKIKELGLIKDLDEKSCLQVASYDLRLGSKHFLFEEAGAWNAIFLGEPTELNKENQDLSDSALILRLPHQGSDKLIIPPFGSAIIELKETIDLYTVAKDENLLVAGRFDLKLKAIYKGLISQQATQVEPCYMGKLYCFIHNLSSNHVVLSKDEKIATLEFSLIGQCLSDEEKRHIINETITHNYKKFNSDRFTPNHTGIEDIRWLHTAGMLPEECGIAPIHKLVKGNIHEAVDAHLEKSDMVDKLADSVGSKLSEKQNAIKIVFSLIAAVITFFATSFLIEVKAELRYFSEQLSFFANSNSDLDSNSLAAISQHTSELAGLRQGLWIYTIAAIVIIVVLLLVLFFVYMRPMDEQKWKHKLKKLEAKSAFHTYKRNHKNTKRRPSQILCKPSLWCRIEAPEWRFSL